MNKGSFKKGNVPWNKDLKGIHLNQDTEFKPGENHTGKNHPSWRGGVQKSKKDCTYLHTGNGTRVRRPRKIYEDNFGPIPFGFVIIHKDNNKDNDDPKNLKAISRSENMKRNSRV
jgi:hypothetical protein